MKRIYKIIILFIAIFLTGILFFTSYIDHALDHKEVLKSADSSNTAQKSTAKIIDLH